MTPLDKCKSHLDKLHNFTSKIKLRKIVNLQKKIRKNRNNILEYYRGPGINNTSLCVNAPDYYFTKTINEILEKSIIINFFNLFLSFVYNPFRFLKKIIARV